MKHFYFTFMLLSCLITSSVTGQDIDIAWSEKMIGTNKELGFFDGFIGSNSEYLYAKFSNLANRPKNKNNSIRYVAFDKKTMKVAKEKIICGFGSSKTTNNKYAELSYLRSVVFENSIFIFWTSDSSPREVVFVESYDKNLNPLEKLDKIYEADYLNSEARQSSVVILSNLKLGEQVLIVNPVIDKNKKQVVIDYKLVNNKLKDEKSAQLELPFDIVQDYASLSVSGSYTYGDDGNLYALCTVYQANDKLFTRLKTKSDSFLSVIDVNKRSVSSMDLAIDDESKNVISRIFEVNADGIHVYGFYKNADDITSKRTTAGADGVFYAKANPKAGKIDKVTYNEFTKEFLDELLGADYEGKKAREEAEKKSRKKKDDAELAWSYGIEYSEVFNGEVVLLCTKTNNYSSTSCDSKGNCTTRYYCNKEDVMAIKLDTKGKLVWATNLDRAATYGGWDIEDIHAIEKNKTLYVTYGSSFLETAEKKNRKSAKSKELVKDFFEYATLNLSTGKFEKQSHRVNATNTDPKEAKSVSALGIQVLDNTMYINSMRTRVNPVYYLACLIPCPLAWYYPFVSPNAKKGTGYLGKITAKD